MRILIFSLLLILALAAPAWPYPATVIDCHDGDTVTLDTGQRVRIWGVDAPEAKSRKWAAQPGWQGSRDALAAMVMWQIVEVTDKGRSYDRVVGIITLADGRDVSAELVRMGWAWVEPRYCKSKRVCGPMVDAQEEARAKGLGLWGLGAAVPPWEWRKQAK